MLEAYAKPLQLIPVFAARKLLQILPDADETAWKPHLTFSDHQLFPIDGTTFKGGKVICIGMLRE
jgi:hypothetical protein